jgi:Flp pilus assembly protein TadG
MTCKIRNSLSKFSRAERGIAAIEMAIVFPTMVLMYFGMLDLTSFITMNRRVMNAASVMADLVTANEDYVLGTQVSDYYNAPDMILAPVPTSNVRTELFVFKPDGSTRWSANNGRGPSCGGAPSSATALANMSSAGNDVLVARVCAEYKPFFGTFMGNTLLGSTTIKLTKTMYERPRISKVIDCFATVKGGAAC